MKTCLPILCLACALCALMSACDDRRYSKSVAIADCQDGAPLEICDGLDNDCDGEIDEDQGLEAACEGFAPGGCATLKRVCAPDGQTQCVPDVVLANGQTCQDACTQGGQCQDGQCVGAQALTCDDADGCTEDSCNPAVGCVHTTRIVPECCDIQTTQTGMANVFGRGRIEDITLSGDNVAYMAAANMGVHVVDVSNPSSPRQIGWVDTPGWAQRLAVQGDTLYVGERMAAEGQGDTAAIRRVDISDPSAPQLMDQQTGQARYLITDVEVQGDVAAILHYSGLQMVDISDPMGVTALSSLSIGDSNAMSWQGDRLYVLNADLPGRLHVYDTTDPTDLTLLATSNDVPAFSFDVLAHKDRLYVSKYDQISVYDISNDRLARIVNDGQPTGRSMFVEDNLLLVVGSRGFRIFDVTNPAPDLLATSPTPEDTTSVVARPGVAFVGIGHGPLLQSNIGTTGFDTLDGGLRVYDLSDPQDPQVIGASYTPGASRRVHVIDDVAYVADMGGGLRIFNVSNPTRLIEQGHIPIPNALAQEVIHHGNWLILCLQTSQGSRFELYDRTSPFAPIKLSELELPDIEMQIVVDDNGVIFATGRRDGYEHHLSVVDTSPDGRLTLAQDIFLDDFHTGDLVIQGPYLYVASNALMAFDITAPLDPQLVGQSEDIFSGITLAAGPPGIIYGTGTAIQNALVIWDVSDPSLPIEVGRAEFENPAEGLTAKDGFLYVASGASGLRIFDVSDPTTPTEVHQAPTLDHAWGLHLEDQTLFVADSYGLLQSVTLSCQ